MRTDRGPPCFFAAIFIIVVTVAADFKTDVDLSLGRRVRTVDSIHRAVIGSIATKASFLVRFAGFHHFGSNPFLPVCRFVRLPKTSLWTRLL